MQPDQHPCPECGGPADNVDFDGKPKKYCGRRCASAVATRMSQRAYAIRRGEEVACFGCGKPYLPPSLTDPCCSLRCVHGKRRRAAA